MSRFERHEQAAATASHWAAARTEFLFGSLCGVGDFCSRCRSFLREFPQLFRHDCASRNASAHAPPTLRPCVQRLKQRSPLTARKLAIDQPVEKNVVVKTFVIHLRPSAFIRGYFSCLQTWIELVQRLPHFLSRSM